jgi:adenine-specific DNA methylase
MERFFPTPGFLPRYTFIFARTVPCPDTGFETPLVPDWHLLKPKSGVQIVAVPVVDKSAGTWTIKVQVVGPGADQARTPPLPSYGKGTGISLFSGRPIPSDYIKAQALAGRMGSCLYAVAVKTPQGLKFESPQELDLRALADAEVELAKHRERWEQEQILPTEKRYHGDCDRSCAFGLTTWALLFTPRQLLSMGVLVEELRAMRPEIVAQEGEERAKAVEHLLAFALDKLIDYNCSVNTWENTRGTAKHLFQRHDFSFKATYAEMELCSAGSGLAWVIDNVAKAYSGLLALPRAAAARPVELSQGSATHMPQFSDGSITAIVVDPPYDDNVQYAELADFFYVWLKRTQGHRRPEWFSTYLCEHDEEAVVNLSRFRNGDEKAKGAKEQARVHYRGLMTGTFRECRRILRDDGVLTVMFTHKKQEAWEALFAALIEAGFTITATWPVKTESEHSLHQAKKNAAQSTVVLVARKRPAGAGIGYFDHAMVEEIRERARACAGRLQSQGLNRVDQLVGSFGPAIEVYSQYDDVKTDTGQPVGVSRAIDEASDAVSQWCIDQLAARGLDGVEPEGRFALLCWDVLGASEFRFNEAMLLGHAVGMDVDDLIGAGLVKKQGDKVWILSAQQRRRDKALEKAEEIETLFGRETKSKRARKADALKVHPSDPVFRTALDACQALALRYLEAGGGSGGIGNARALANQQSWKADGPVARLMSALLEAAPPALRKEAGARSAAALFPEFRAWHVLLTALFGLPVPDWSAPVLTPLTLGLPADAMPEDVDDELDEEIEDEENEEEE